MSVETIIQGGAVGIAVFALWIIYKLASNHINHNTAVLTELKEAIVNLKDFLQRR